MSSPNHAKPYSEVSLTEGPAAVEQLLSKNFFSESTSPPSLILLSTYERPCMLRIRENGEADLSHKMLVLQLRLQAILLLVGILRVAGHPE